MLVVSMREFRANQGKYLDMVNNGTELILKSRENGSFALTPVTKNHTIISKDYIVAPDKDLSRAITGDELLERIIPRVENLFNK